MRASMPTARLISVTSAPVTSHRAEMELIDDTRCAKKALATNLDSSDDHRLVVRILSREIQLAYTLTTVSMASSPSGVCGPPIRTRSGSCRSVIAVPSARNSGLLRTWKVTLGFFSLADRMRLMASAVRTGTVDFSTTILDDVETRAMWRAHNSQFLMLAAEPAPIPLVFVGVLTEMKMTSASAISLSRSVEKNRFLPRDFFTHSIRPGS
mmetsp:Transcript_7920/g.17018  ORF Transcript_7920/g.17018 Transcript_7920/m.17018 type:complete len:210 (+) Transcript_7920:747-1376(+)